MRKEVGRPVRIIACLLVDQLTSPHGVIASIAVLDCRVQQGGCIWVDNDRCPCVPIINRFTYEQRIVVEVRRLHGCKPNIRCWACYHLLCKLHYHRANDRLETGIVIWSNPAVEVHDVYAKRLYVLVDGKESAPVN